MCLRKISSGHGDDGFLHPHQVSELAKMEGKKFAGDNRVNNNRIVNAFGTDCGLKDNTM